MAAWSLVSSAVAAGANSGTTPSISTTTADVIVIVTCRYLGSVSITDSASNTWTALTELAGGTDTASKTKAFYVITPTTSGTHTFTGTWTAAFGSMVVMVFTQGSAPTFVAEVGTAYSGTGSTVQAGSIGANNELVVEGFGYDGTNPNGTLSIDGAFSTIVQQNYVAGTNEGSASAWKQVTGAVNPTWSWTGAATAGAIACSFTGTGAGGRTTKNTRAWPLGTEIGMGWRQECGLYVPREMAA